MSGGLCRQCWCHYIGMRKIERKPVGNEFCSEHVEYEGWGDIQCILLDSRKFYSFNKYLSSPGDVFFFFFLTFDEIECSICNPNNVIPRIFLKKYLSQLYEM